jgi:hypothetical protein
MNKESETGKETEGERDRERERERQIAIVHTSTEWRGVGRVIQ